MEIKERLFKKLIKSDTKESTKRYLAIYATIVLFICCGWIAYFHGEKHGMNVIWALISFILILLGLASVETVATIITSIFNRNKIEENGSDEATNG